MPILIYGIFCESQTALERGSNAYHKWVWAARAPKTIAQAKKIFKWKSPNGIGPLFKYQTLKPRRSEPVPISWFNEEAKRQENLGYNVEYIFEETLHRYRPSMIKRRSEKWQKKNLKLAT